MDCQEYQWVLWVGADTTEALNASYTELSKALQLPERNAEEQGVLIQAVKDWLGNKQNWLLILDNADELPLVQAFLPSRFAGHLLLTTRARALGKMAQRFEVDIMNEEVGALLLLRRAGFVATHASIESASPANRAAASQIANELGGLPLALDQAGAYIEETGCSLTNYLALYKTRSAKLLHLRGGIGADEHPEPVTTTWSLSFEQVKHLDPAATDLLHFLSFLAPDAIPEELILTQAGKLGLQLAAIETDEIRLDQLVKILTRFSLIQRNSAERLFVMHRLVQTILKAQMTDGDRRLWIERTVYAVGSAFPFVVNVDRSPWERLLPHALVCVELIDDQALTSKEAVHLLWKTTKYLLDRAYYKQAESLLERLIAIDKTSLAFSLLADIYIKQGRYAEAELFYQRALDAHDPDDMLIVNRLHDLADLYKGNLYETYAAQYLKYLADLYVAQSKYKQAEVLYQRAVAIDEEVFGSDHPNITASLGRLAALYKTQGKYDQAEPLLQRSLAIYDQHLGTARPITSTIRANYLSLLEAMKQDEETP